MIFENIQILIFQKKKLISIKSITQMVWIREEVLITEIFIKWYHKRRNKVYSEIEK